MNKTVFALIAAALIATAGPLFAQDFRTEPDGAGGVVISGYTGEAVSVAIPAAIGGRPVTGIGDRAFSGCTGLASVTIPVSVTAIGNYTFESCSGLASITLPEGVTRIGNFAFSGCAGFTSVTIPAGVTSIGAAAFYGCTGLPAISVSAENRSYKDIDGVVFSKDGETLVAYPAGGKTAYQIPSGVTGIGNGAFGGCSGLVSVTIPEGVTRIGMMAFAACTGLTAVTIPASVTTIDWGPFSACTGLPAISVSAENRSYRDIDGVVFSKDGKTLVAYPAGGKTDYLIPEGVTSIGSTAFSYCSGLVSVTIPESVTVIGYAAFSRCSGLVSITIPDSVTSVDEGAFSDCGKLDKACRDSIGKRFGDGVF